MIIEIATGIISVLALISLASYALTGEVIISVSIAEPDYHSYTVAINQIQDYYIECSGENLINQTPIGDPIITDFNEEGFC